ncbi:MerR family transcriptional regulator [Ectobacillus panaciterrae]|uniref:MerR family transcriptional regulator n=1 Tax=Ectobacillus panaciterrae TaxID=363872 RepID=UPI000402997E|nr:MerR family transcriptional regulator [Ectobacillus panaciterrae]
MKNRFLIGEMSKLHNTSIKTLRYYDEIGLFEPIEIDENNGYRYYSTEQFEQLNTINYLKALGLSLKEIKVQLENRDIEYFLKLLKKQKEITENKIKELELIRSRFENRIKELDQARRIKELEVVIIKHLQERKIVSLKEKICSEPELELSLRKLENISNKDSSIFIGGVGLTVAIHNIKKMKFNEYNSIFILLEEDLVDTKLVTTLQQSEYACIYYRGNHNDSPKYYRILLDYIDKNGLQIIGDSIERTIIDQFISKNKEDYLTEIQIPVAKLTLQ